MQQGSASEEEEESCNFLFPLLFTILELITRGIHWRRKRRRIQVQMLCTSWGLLRLKDVIYDFNSNLFSLVDDNKRDERVFVVESKWVRRL